MESKKSIKPILLTGMRFSKDILIDDQWTLRGIESTKRIIELMAKGDINEQQ
tara:strand:- start:573 stop:728 length:156 start_codon:yes stop_codon:yes gene_type:complete